MIPIPGLSPIVARLVLVAAIAAAGAALGWTLNGWRLGEEVAQLQTAVTALKAQGDVLAGAVRACNAGVDQAAKAGAAALAQGRDLLAEARRLSAGGRRQAERIEQLLAQPTPAGADCGDAWHAIERDRKAGATP